MTRFYSILFTFLLFWSTSLHAQDAPQTAGSGKYPIEYQFPANGETDVQQRTTLIIRPSKTFMQGHSASDFSFSVIGEISGIHKGKIFISDDNQTVIFKPEQPFSVSENVSVKLEISGSENYMPLSYSFRITAMSEFERGQALYKFYQSEQKQDQEYFEESLKHTQSQATPSSVSISGLPLDATIDILGNHAQGNVFFTVTKSFPSPYSFLAVINDTGVLFTRNVPDGAPITKSDGCGNFQPIGNDRFVFFKQQLPSPVPGVFFGIHQIMNRRGDVVDSFQCGNRQIADLHDFHLMPNGHAILLAYSPRTFNMKTLLCAPDTAKTDATVFDAVIQELDQDKHVVMEWNSKDHFSPCDATPEINLGAKLIDYNHINTAVIDSSDGNMIASFRHMDEVTKINWKTGATIWRWGGKNNMFTFEGDTLKFSHQHDPARIFNGNITMWDNGNLRPKDTVINGKDTVVNRPFSRAIEYQLDEINHKAKTIWEYRNVPYSAAAGNVQTLSNGNRFIGTGIVGAPAAIELDRQSDAVVYQLSIVPLAFVYRAYRFDTDPPAQINSVTFNGTAQSFAISSIFPNPAENSTTISFSVPEAGPIEIELLDILGHSVRSITEKLPAAGAYSASLDVHYLPNGIYYCNLTQYGKSFRKAIIVQK